MLSKHIEESINSLLCKDNISPQSFVQVRRLVQSRLILLNGRRCGEPSLVTIIDMNTEIARSWFHFNESDDEIV